MHVILGNSEGLESSVNSSFYEFLFGAFLAIIFGTGLALLIMTKGANTTLLLTTAALFFIPAAIFICLAVQNRILYSKFGQARLFLDPRNPSVGGALAGRFNLSLNWHYPSLYIPGNLQAKLYCNKGWKSAAFSPGVRPVRTTLWQKSVPVELKRTKTGVDASFRFDLPDSSKPTNLSYDLSGIYWELVVTGEFEKVGKFKRLWNLKIKENDLITRRAQA